MIVTILTLTMLSALLTSCVTTAVFFKTVRFFTRTAWSHLMGSARLTSSRFFSLRSLWNVLVFMWFPTFTDKIGAIHSLTYIRTHTLLKRRFAIILRWLSQLYFLIFQSYAIWTAVIFNTAFMNFVKAWTEMPKAIIIITKTFMHQRSAITLVALRDRFL